MLVIGLERSTVVVSLFPSFRGDELLFEDVSGCDRSLTLASHKHVSARPQLPFHILWEPQIND